MDVQVLSRTRSPERESCNVVISVIAVYCPHTLPSQPLPELCDSGTCRRSGHATPCKPHKHFYHSGLFLGHPSCTLVSKDPGPMEGRRV